MYDLTPSIASMFGFVVLLSVYYAVKSMSDSAKVNASFTVTAISRKSGTLPSR
jgi:hypothetical protein